MKDRSASFGTEPIPQLLIKQAVPASIGILVMSLNILIDTIFVYFQDRRIMCTIAYTS